jgi:hypothetical protein
MEGRRRDDVDLTRERRGEEEEDEDLEEDEDEEIRQAQGVYSREREKVSLHFCYLSYIWSVCPLPD